MYLLEKQPEQINEALYSACEGGHNVIIEKLISMGADNWDYGFIGACRGKHIAPIKEMIARGATIFDIGLKIVCEGVILNTPVLELVNLMIEKGANNFNEALFACCQADQCSYKVMKLLVSKGADDFNEAMSNACTYGNLLAAMYMVYLGVKFTDNHFLYACRSKNLKLVEYLVENYSNKIITNKVLTITRKYGKPEIVEYLIKNGAVDIIL